MEIIAIKLLFIGAVFVIGVIGGLAPLRIKATAATALHLARGNAFAAGIFLGAGLLHMLPDARVNFGVVMPMLDYPLPALLAGAAVLLILLTDQVGRSAQGPSSGGARKRSLLLFVVLSLHSMIAGAALGLETVLIASVSIFIAIIAHKGAAGFALGTALVSDGAAAADHRRTIYMFAATTPVGIALGTYLSVAFTSNVAIGIEAVFDALAAGTFVYIALVDIFKEAFENSNGRWSKLVLALLGFALMAALALWS